MSGTLLATNFQPGAQKMTWPPGTVGRLQRVPLRIGELEGYLVLRQPPSVLSSDQGFQVTLDVEVLDCQDWTLVELLRQFMPGIVTE